MYISGGGNYRIAAEWRAKLKADRRRRMIRFAELLAEGYTITAAAKSVNVSQQAGSEMLKDIKEELGPQAR